MSFELLFKGCQESKEQIQRRQNPFLIFWSWEGLYLRTWEPQIGEKRWSSSMTQVGASVSKVVKVRTKTFWDFFEIANRNLIDVLVRQETVHYNNPIEKRWQHLLELIMWNRRDKQEPQKADGSTIKQKQEKERTLDTQKLIFSSLVEDNKTWWEEGKPKSTQKISLSK